MQDIVSECPEVRLGLSNFFWARAQMVGRLLCLPYNFCSDLGSGFENIFKRWNLSLLGQQDTRAAMKVKALSGLFSLAL